MKTKPYPLAYIECERPVLVVVIVLVMLLSLMKTISDVMEEGVPIHQLFVHRLHSRCAQVVGAKSRWVTVVDDAKRRCLERRME